MSEREEKAERIFLDVVFLGVATAAALSLNLRPEAGIAE